MRSYSRLIIDDYPIQVLPTLAKEIGLNEAIVVQQIHYWLSGKSAKMIDGRKWIYNTYEDWQKQFPFWSNATIRRAINSCEKKKVVLSANYNKAGFDKTKWYTIDYEMIERVSNASAQNEQRSCSKWADGVAQNEQTNTIDYTETTSETNKDTMSSNLDNGLVKEVVEYLNEKTGKQYRPSSSKTKTLIQARMNEGFKKSDFLKVIDVKVDEWGESEKWRKYLRPETLFGTKFEGYLNQEGMDGSEYDGLF